MPGTRREGKELMARRSQKRKIWDRGRVSQAVVAKGVILCHRVTLQLQAGESKPRISQRLLFPRT